eukprot:12353776-Alexandrium_andersonii.AAC.1
MFTCTTRRPADQASSRRWFAHTQKASASGVRGQLLRKKCKNACQKAVPLFAPPPFFPHHGPETHG